MKECCDVLYHSYVDPASIWPDSTSDPAGSGSKPDPDTTKFIGYPAGSGSGSSAPLDTVNRRLIRKEELHRFEESS